tara:strand:- start:15 stop:617 length:603 start_codon:yes stop_codon:yes gene_type:complete
MELDLKREVTKNVSEPSIIIEFAIEEVMKTFKKEGGISPLITLECDDDQDYLKGLPLPPDSWESQEKKVMASELIRGFVNMMENTGEKPVLVFSAMEAWMSPPIDKDNIKAIEDIVGNVVKMPDKREVLIFNLETKTQTRCITYEIIRGENDSFVISDKPIHDDIHDKVPGAGIQTNFQVWHLDNEGSPLIGETRFKVEK